MNRFGILAALAAVSGASVFACTSFSGDSDKGTSETGDGGATPAPESGTGEPAADAGPPVDLTLGQQLCSDFTAADGVSGWEAIPNSGAKVVQAQGLVLKWTDSGHETVGLKRAFKTNAPYTHSEVVATLTVEQHGSWVNTQYGPFIDFAAQFYGDPPSFEGTAHVDYAFTPGGFDVDVYDRPDASGATNGPGHPLDQHVDGTQVPLTGTGFTSNVTWGTAGQVYVAADGAKSVTFPTSTSTIAAPQSFTLVLGGTAHQTVQETTVTIAKVCVTLKP